MATSVRAFISYSHDTVEHSDWVLQVADRLRDDGVDAWIDRYELSPEGGWMQWMERLVEQAEFVLVVCTETYRRRFDGREEPGVGLGVAWEARLAKHLEYHGSKKQVVPVYRSTADAKHIPVVLSDRPQYCLFEDYEKLYRRLTNQPEAPARPVGSLRKLEPVARLVSRSDGLPVDVAIDAAPASAPASPVTLSGSPREWVEQLEALLLEREREKDTRRQDALTSRIDHFVSQIRQDRHYRADDVVAGTKLVKVIGTGNFGTIWLSQRIDNGRDAATKVFHLDKLTLSLMLWRFRRGAKAMVQLRDHRDTPASIVRLHEISDDGLAFSMDFLAGGDLDEVAKRGWTDDKKLEHFATICRAVAFAHRIGVIHRDIKPANVVLDDQGRPVLTDFDIADVKFATRLSVVKGGLGTPVFAAPEQLEEGNLADERSDVYSLGRLLHYLLLERSPGYQIEADPSLENLARFPPAITAIVRKATQLQPDRRYPDVTSLQRDVESCQSRWAAMRARLRASVRWVRRMKAVLVIFLLVVGGVSGYAFMQKKANEQQKEATAAAQRHAQELAGLIDQIKEAQRKITAVQSESGNVAVEIGVLETKCPAIEEKLNAAPVGSAEHSQLSAQVTECDSDLARKKEQRAEIEKRLKGFQDSMDELERKAEEQRRTVATISKVTTVATPEPSSTTVSLVPDTLRAGETNPPIAGTTPEPTPSPAPSPTAVATIGLKARYRPAMMVIPDERFLMGSEDTEDGRDGDENLHRVTISRGFYLAQTEVTQGQYDAVMGKNPSDNEKCGDKCPVESVSWTDAVKYCNKLSTKEGVEKCYVVKGDNANWTTKFACKGYRLPTEAEWEYAARAHTRFRWAGTDDLPTLGEFANVSRSLVEVGSLKPNGFGLYDMSGNVQEWVWDWYDKYPQDEATDPVGAQRGSFRVNRGGSFIDLPRYARVASRSWDEPSRRAGDLGFRVARSLP